MYHVSSNYFSAVPGFCLSNSLFNRQGQISSDFENQLLSLGFKLHSYIERLAPGHICNVIKLLESTGCFNKDKPGLSFSFEQAGYFLRQLDREKFSILPKRHHLKGKIDAIIPAPKKFSLGAMYKRLNSLYFSLYYGYHYRQVYVIVPNEEAMLKTHDMLLRMFPSLIKDTQLEYKVYEGVLEDILPQFDQKKLAKKFVLIGGDCRIENLQYIAKKYLYTKQYIGSVYVPTSTWEEEVSLYDYFQKVETEEEAVKLFAWNCLYYKAREVDKIYQHHYIRKPK